MKSKLANIILCLMGALLVLSLVNSLMADEEKDIVAQIGEKTISEGDLAKEMQEQASQFGVKMNMLSGEKKDQYRKIILHRMVDKILILDQGKKKNIDVSKEDVQKELDSVKQKFPDEKAFQNLLAQKNVTEDDVKEMIRENLLIKKIMDDITSSVSEVSDADVKKYYDENQDKLKQAAQVKASHILLKVDEDASEEDAEKVKKKIEEIREKIKSGGDFAKLAEEFSDCPSGKRAGGDLGWFGKGQMVPPFEKAAFAMKPGELSDIVKTRFGYHIIKLTDKKEEGVPKLEEMSDDIKEELSMQNKSESFSSWLEKEKEQKVKFSNADDREFGLKKESEKDNKDKEDKKAPDKE